MVTKPTFDAVDESNPDTYSPEHTRTTNEAGGVSYETLTPEFGLYKVVINQLIEDTYYDTVDQAVDKIWDQYDRVADENPEFILQLATYARHEEGLRDIPQLLLVFAANDDRVVQPDNADSSLIRDYTPSIIDRTDEFNTVLSYQMRGYGKPIPNGLKKGIEDALHKKYQIVEVKDEDRVMGTERVTFIEHKHNSFMEDGWEYGMPTTHRNKDAAHMRAIESVTGESIESFMGSTSVTDEGYVHDEYTFAKYSQRDKQVSLHDVLNLVRPKPRSAERNTIFESIAKGELSEGIVEKDHWDVGIGFEPQQVEPLREDRTWESELSEDDDRSDAEKFRERLDDMGLFARVRNLRNMLEAGLSGEEIFDYDDGSFGPNSHYVVSNSKLWAFRFYQSYKACGDVGVNRIGYGDTVIDIGRGSLLDETTEQWLSGAIDVSTRNLPDALKNTFTAVDLSGSMDREVSNNSELARAEIASLFGAMMMKRDSGVGVFGSKFARVTVDSDARETLSVLDMTERIYASGKGVGSATNGWKAVQYALDEEIECDRFIVFTDEQLWNSGHRMFGGTVENKMKNMWDQYRNDVNPDAHLYIVDLASYGDISFPEGYHNVHQISGWSSNIIDYIIKNEDSDSIISRVESISGSDY